MQQAERAAALPEFSGKKKDQELASEVFQVFRARGAFYSASAPIRIALDDIVAYLEATGSKADQKAIASALRENQHVFAEEERDGQPLFVTTRIGKAPGVETVDGPDPHDLPSRFATPEPPREKPQPRATFEPATGEPDSGAQAPDFEFPPDSWQAAVAAALRDAQSSEAAGEATDEDVEVTEVEGRVPVEAAEDVVFEDTSIAEMADEEVAAEDEVVAEEPAPAGEAIDIDAVSDEELELAVESLLLSEPDAVRWGDQWMHESNVSRLSRGDIRKLQELLAEADEAVSDVDLVQDLRGLRPGTQEFDTERFALNYRMSREVREFEFVGTAQHALWAQAGLPPIGTEKRKASEIGQDYRFLLDYLTPDSVIEEGIVEHVLTFYEHHYGVLPLNANFATLMPRAAFNDQRATRLTFESPQTMESFEVELRYPTTNRGGYLVGFEDFFAENLVPGAVLTIEATPDSETHFIIEYFQISRQDRKLLHLNERRGRYVFQSTTYYCATQDEMLIDDNHFEQLANTEPLPESVRRRPEQVVAATFERIGTKDEVDGQTRYRAALVDLLAVANIERPISEPFLRDILSGGAYPEFSADESEEDAFFYIPTS